MLKIANFCCHGNNEQGSVRAKCDWHIHVAELADPENHTIEPKITTLSYIQPKLWQISGKIPNFSLPWQRGSFEQSLNDTIKLANPENPLVGVSVWGVSPAQAEL